MVFRRVPLRSSSPLAWSYHWATAHADRVAADPAPPPARAGREDPTAQWTPLPAGPRLTVAAEDVLRSRSSCRWFSTAAVRLPDLAALLRHGYGVIEADARPVPSAGAGYPLELTVIVRSVDGLAAGVHHYVPFADGLELVRSGPPAPGDLAFLFLGQRWVVDAAAILVISAVTERSLVGYGDRGYRYLLLEAGHVGQNLAIAATALRLGICHLGAFRDHDLSRLLRLRTAYEVPLYCAAVGQPATGGRTDQLPSD